MKILLIMPYNSDLIHAVSLPLGLISIATNLKHHGYDVKICDMSVSHVKIEKVFDDYYPDIVGISLMSVKHLDGAMHVSKKLHKKGVPIVWGELSVILPILTLFFNAKMLIVSAFVKVKQYG